MRIWLGWSRRQSKQPACLSYRLLSLEALETRRPLSINSLTGRDVIEAVATPVQPLIAAATSGVSAPTDNASIPVRSEAAHSPADNSLAKPQGQGEVEPATRLEAVSAASTDSEPLGPSSAEAVAASARATASRSAPELAPQPNVAAAVSQTVVTPELTVAAKGRGEARESAEREQSQKAASPAKSDLLSNIVVTPQGPSSESSASGSARSDSTIALDPDAPDERAAEPASGVAEQDASAPADPPQAMEDLTPRIEIVDQVAGHVEDVTGHVGEVIAQVEDAVEPAQNAIEPIEHAEEAAGAIPDVELPPNAAPVTQLAVSAEVSAPGLSRAAEQTLAATESVVATVPVNVVPDLPAAAAKRAVGDTVDEIASRPLRSLPPATVDVQVGLKASLDRGELTLKTNVEAKVEAEVIEVKASTEVEVEVIEVKASTEVEAEVTKIKTSAKVEGEVGKVQASAKVQPSTETRHGHADAVDKAKEKEFAIEAAKEAKKKERLLEELLSEVVAVLPGNSQGEREIGVEQEVIVPAKIQVAVDVQIVTLFEPELVPSPHLHVSVDSPENRAEGEFHTVDLLDSTRTLVTERVLPAVIDGSDSARNPTGNGGQGGAAAGPSAPFPLGKITLPWSDPLQPSGRPTPVLPSSDPHVHDDVDDDLAFSIAPVRPSFHAEVHTPLSSTKHPPSTHDEIFANPHWFDELNFERTLLREQMAFEQSAFRSLRDAEEDEFEQLFPAVESEPDNSERNAFVALPEHTWEDLPSAPDLGSESVLSESGSAESGAATPDSTESEAGPQKRLGSSAARIGSTAALPDLLIGPASASNMDAIRSAIDRLLAEAEELGPMNLYPWLIAAGATAGAWHVRRRRTRQRQQDASHEPDSEDASQWLCPELVDLANYRAEK